MRLLIVDVEAESRRKVAEMLGQAGYDTDGVGDANAAKEILARGQIDVVLTDTVLGPSRGTALLSEFKRAAPETLVLMMADAPNRSMAIDAVRNGAVDYVTKPVEPGPLLMAVERAAELQSLRRHRARLETEVAAQSAVLASRNVVLDRMTLAREEQSSFLINDLRNPLTTIQANLDHLLRAEGLPADETRRALSDAFHATKRLSQMVSDMLDVGRSAEGRLAMQWAKLPAQRLFDEIAARHRAHAAETGGEIAVEVASDALIETDPELLKRLLGNLIDNALLRAGRNLHLVIGLDLSQANRQLVTLTDDGPTMTDEQREQLFERFERGAPRPLEMAFCKVAAAAHGGTIRAVAIDPRGTRYEIALPIPT